MKSHEMVELAKSLRKEDMFVGLTIADVKKMVRKEKQHLASTFTFHLVNVIGSETALVGIDVAWYEYMLR